MKLKKGHNSHKNWWILPLIELDLHFIYLCLKYESNTLTFSKNIERKTFLACTDGMDGKTYVGTAVILYGPPPTESGREHNK